MQIPHSVPEASLQARKQNCNLHKWSLCSHGISLLLNPQILMITFSWGKLKLYIYMTCFLSFWLYQYISAMCHSFIAFQQKLFSLLPICIFLKDWKCGSPFPVSELTSETCINIQIYTPHIYTNSANPVMLVHMTPH